MNLVLFFQFVLMLIENSLKLRYEIRLSLFYMIVNHMKITFYLASFNHQIGFLPYFVHVARGWAFKVDLNSLIQMFGWFIKNF